MLDYIACTIIAAGIVFLFFAALSLLRLPEAAARIIGSTRCATAGAAAVLLGVFVLNGFSATGVKALLCLLLILVLSPVEAHVLLRAALKADQTPLKGSTENHAKND